MAKTGLGVQVVGGVIGIGLMFTPLFPLGAAIGIGSGVGGGGTVVGAAIAVNEA